MDSFTRGSLRFRVLETGDGEGETVILLHGFPENAATWSGVASRLAEAGYRVLAFDQRGYSSEARPTSRLSYRLENLVGDVAALVQASGSERVHLVGHDWGGVVAWAYASKFPKTVLTLTSVATPHPRAFAETLLVSRQLLSSWYMLLFQLPYLPEYLLRRNDGRMMMRYLVGSGLSEEHARAYVKDFVDNRSLTTGALNWYRALPFDVSTGIGIRKTIVPTLYVVGDHDIFVSKKAITHTSRWVAGVYRLELLSDTYHWIPEETSATLSSIIVEFIGNNPQVSLTPA